MKKILFLLVMLFCSLNVIGGERITSGYCEGRGKILKKFMSLLLMILPLVQV